MSEENRHFVAVIGAGPAGLFGARELAVQGARVPEPSRSGCAAVRRDAARRSFP